MRDFDWTRRNWDDEGTVFPPTSHSSYDDASDVSNDTSIDRDESIAQLQAMAERAVDEVLHPAHKRHKVAIDEIVTLHTGSIWSRAAADLERTFNQISWNETVEERYDHFSLSTEVITILRNSIPAFAATDDLLTSEFEFGTASETLSDEQISGLVCNQVSLMFASYARHLAQVGERIAVISSYGEFLPEIDIMLQNRIPFFPRRFALLSDQILTQMEIPYIRDTMNGNWGYFDYDDRGNLSMIVTIDAVQNNAGHTATIVIEKY